MQVAAPITPGDEPKKNTIRTPVSLWVVQHYSGFHYGVLLGPAGKRARAAMHIAWLCSCYPNCPSPSLKESYSPSSLSPSLSVSLSCAACSPPTPTRSAPTARLSGPPELPTAHPPWHPCPSAGSSRTLSAAPAPALPGVAPHCLMSHSADCWRPANAIPAPPTSPPAAAPPLSPAPRSAPPLAFSSSNFSCCRSIRACARAEVRPLAPAASPA